MEKRKNLNFFKLLFISTLTILASFSIVNTNIFAATTDSNVTTSYSLYDNLSSQQKQQIVTGQPNIKLSHDHEKVTLIYKTKQNSQPTPPTNGQNGGNNIQNDGNTVVGPTTISNELADKPLLANRSAGLPQTAQGNSNRLLLPLVFMIMLIALGLLIWQRKHMRSILLAYVILGSSLAASGFVNAAAALPNEQTQTLAKGSTYSPNTAQEGYDYVGYIYTSNDDPIPEAHGQVTVYYQDAQGQNLAKQTVLVGNVGDSYTTTAASVKGYTLKTTPANANGTFTDQDQTVTYVYSKDPVAGGSVTTKYVDEQGNTIAPDQVQQGNVGDSYTTTAASVKGYTLKTTPANANGTFTDQEQMVTYVYSKNIKTTVNMLKSGIIHINGVGFEQPYYYKVTYYDKDNNVMKEEEVHHDIIISNETLGEFNNGDNYKTYAKVVYQGYVEKTNQEADYLIYELDADNPELTSGIVGDTPINIQYTLNDLSFK